MQHSSRMLEYLETADVDGMRRLWRAVAPQMPQHGAADTLIRIHMARTMTEAVKFSYRAWSHRWLTERGLPSQLPDQDRPKAERIFPVISPCVGIMVASKWPNLKAEIVRAMQIAVLEAQADGRLMEHEFVRGRMLQARAAIRRKLLG